MEPFGEQPLTGRFHVQLRSGIKSLKPMNLKPKVLLQRDVLAHQLLNMAAWLMLVLGEAIPVLTAAVAATEAEARNDSCANVPASVLASRVANVMWFLGLERRLANDFVLSNDHWSTGCLHRGTGDCTEMTCSYFEGITWTQDLVCLFFDNKQIHNLELQVFKMGHHFLCSTSLQKVSWRLLKTARDLPKLLLQDCQVLGISLPGEESISGKFLTATSKGFLSHEDLLRM